ncbi:hypothetical protein V8F20_006056 [Naviculisporaceae sp. PSN 640]
MAHLEYLAPELLIGILSSCGSMKDLHSLISASPACLRTFLFHRKYIVPSVWRNLLDLQNYRELLAIAHVPSPSPLSTEGDDDHTAAVNLMRLHLEHYFSARPFEDLYDPASLGRMCRVYNTISRLTELYFSHISQVLAGSPGSNPTPVAPPSTAEKTRIQRAFLRYELYSRVFPSVYDEQDEETRSLMTGRDQFHLFISRMKGWEVEELTCVHYFLTSLATGYLLDIENQFVDDFCSCPGVQLPRSEEPKPATKKRPAPSDDNSTSDESSDEDYSSPLPDPKRRRLLDTPDVSSTRERQQEPIPGPPGVRTGAKKQTSENKVEEPQEKMVPFVDPDIYGLLLFDRDCRDWLFPTVSCHLASAGLEFFLKLIDASRDPPKRRRDLIYEDHINSSDRRHFLPNALQHSPLYDANGESTCDKDDEEEWVRKEVGWGEEEDPARPNFGYLAFRPRKEPGTPVYRRYWDRYDNLPGVSVRDELRDVLDFDSLSYAGYVFWDKSRFETPEARDNILRGSEDNWDGWGGRLGWMLSKEVGERLKGVRIPASQWRRLVVDYSMGW